MSTFFLFFGEHCLLFHLVYTLYEVLKILNKHSAAKLMSTKQFLPMFCLAYQKISWIPFSTVFTMLPILYCNVLFHTFDIIYHHNQFM